MTKQYVDLATVPDEQYEEALEDMFQQEGWEYLKAELYANSVLLNDVQEIVDQRDLDFRKGQLSIIGFILNLEDTRTLVKEESDESPE